MKQHSLARRLVAGAVGLMIGLAGVAAFSAPAQATGLSSVKFADDCDGTWVTVKSGGVLEEYNWTVTPENGEAIDLSVPPGEEETVFLASDAGEISVDFANSPGSWPQAHTWSAPVRVDCDAITVDVTQPTCEDENGYIDIPAAPEDLPEHVKPYVYYLIDGEDVTELERGSTVAVGPGTYFIQVYDENGEKIKLLKTLAVEIVPADCPDDEDEDEGEGGELPVTGMTTGLIALSALVLLALGGGLFMLARRRRVTFTA